MEGLVNIAITTASHIATACQHLPKVALDDSDPADLPQRIASAQAQMRFCISLGMEVFCFRWTSSYILLETRHL